MSSTDRDYKLSFDEFMEIVGAIKDIPRIYKHIEKIETNIERLTKEQDGKINDQIQRMSTIKYGFDELKKRVERLEEAALRSPYVQLPKEEDNVSSKDLVNIIVKGLAVLGTIATVVYALIQGTPIGK